jgi:hypothetical protein
MLTRICGNCVPETEYVGQYKFPNKDKETVILVYLPERLRKMALALYFHMKFPTTGTYIWGPHTHNFESQREGYRDKCVGLVAGGLEINVIHCTGRFIVP